VRSVTQCRNLFRASSSVHRYFLFCRPLQLEMSIVNLEQFESRAKELDSADTLAGFRERFYVQPGQIYLDGNSLGLLSRDAEAAVLRVLNDWKNRGIQGWTEAEPDWFTLAETLGAQMAALVGAEPDEVLVTNSTTVNLHQLLATLYDPSAGRTGILADTLNFPSDLYSIQSHLRLRGLSAEDQLVLAPSRDGYTLDEQDIVNAMDRNVGLVVLPSVLYRSGQLLDIPRLANVAKERGILIGFDLSHSIGVVPHKLDEWGIDFAFWCTYKYLNAGPGASGALYLNRRHFGKAPGLAGWFGSRKENQFDMLTELFAANGVGAMQIGTPNILSMAPLVGTLPVILDAGIERIRSKSLALTEFLMELSDSVLSVYGFSVVNPREPHRRGGHVSLAHAESARICRTMRAEGVIPDFRPPDIVRLCPSPLYTSFLDCVEAVRRLARIVENRDFERLESGRGLVS
jgi:kynureninase